MQLHMHTHMSVYMFILTKDIPIMKISYLLAFPNIFHEPSLLLCDSSVIVVNTNCTMQGSTICYASPFI